MRNELSKFALHAESRRRSGVDCRYFVDQIGQPHEVFVVRHVHTPYRIVDKFVADADLLGERLFAEVHKRTAYVKVFVESVIKVETEQGFALHAVERLIFERHADVRARIDDALVCDCDDTHVVVDGIVAVFGEGNATGGNDNRPARHIHGIKANLRARRGLIFAFEDEFVLVLELLCYGLC